MLLLPHETPCSFFHKKPLHQSRRELVSYSSSRQKSDAGRAGGELRSSSGTAGASSIRRGDRCRCGRPAAILGSWPGRYWIREEWSLG